MPRVAPTTAGLRWAVVDIRGEQWEPRPGVMDHTYIGEIQNLVRQDLQHRQALTITEASSGHSRTAHTAPATSPADAAAEKLFSYRAPRRRPAAASSQKPSSPKRAARSQKDRGRSIP